MESTNINTPEQKPSTTGSFLRGFGSGALSGGLMTGIMAGLGAAWTALTTGGTFAAAFTGSLLAVSTPLTVIGVGLFGGIMAAKRAMSGTQSSKSAVNPTIVAIPVPAQAMGLSPTLSMDEAPARADGKSWTEQTSRSANTQNRVQEILANGNMSDKARAEALLAERQTAAQAQQSR